MLMVYKRLTILLYLGIFICVQSYAQTCPSNLDFELGNFTNWKLYTGSCCPINTPTLSGPVTARHTITTITSAADTDFYGGFPIVAPGGGTYSLKLGNNYVGAQAERARYYVHVPSGVNNYSLIFRYAVVFEDPTHTAAQQPRFEVKAFDSITNNVINCSQFTYVSSSSLPGFILSPQSAAALSTIYYKSWTTASINLSGYAGRTVAVDFASGDCAQGGHFGYGYVDLNCGLFQIQTVLNCDTSSTISLTAPPGFASYSWRDSTAMGTVLTTGQTGILTKPSTNKTYAVILTPYSGFGCPDTLYTQVKITNLSVDAGKDTSLCAAGSAQLSATANGTATPLTYSWSPTTGLSCTTCSNPVATVSATKTYYVTAKDANNCTKTDSVTIYVSTLNVKASNDTTICGNSSITLFAGASGNTPLTYSWSPGTALSCTSCSSPVSSTTINRSYYITVTDTFNCVKKDTVNIAISNPSLTLTPTNVSCFNAKNGSISVAVSNGKSPYSYSWNTTPAQTTSTATGLDTGKYAVIMTDSNGCVAQDSAIITQPPLLVAITGTTTNVSCYGGNNGSASVSVTGGTTSYTYSWNTSPTQTSSTSTGLTAGNYIVTVTDSKGCTDTALAIISQPTKLVATTTSTTNVSCYGGSNGAATVSVSGGKGSYTYSWNTSPAQTTATATGLSSGNYIVTVTDSNGCTDTALAVITQPNALVAIVTSTTNVSCYAGNNGAATVSVTGGTSAYTYSWNTSPAQTTATATTLTAGNYIVTVTDSKGCQDTALAVITQPAVLNATVSATANVSCHGGNNGTATVSVTGGTTGYTYSWNTTPAQTTATATGLSAGNYIVTVTDSKGCSDTALAMITEPNALVASIVSTTQVSCNGGNNGIAVATASGGTPSYTYSWNTSPAQTTSTATGLTAGVYVLTVTDSKGCTDTAQATISQSTTLVASISSSTMVSCNGGNNGAASVSVSGGTPSYTYSWNTSPTKTTASVTGLAAGSYTVTVTDSKGCSSFASIAITEPPVLTATMTTSSNVSCYGGSNGAATVSVSGGNGGYSYSWNTSPAQATATATGLGAGTYVVTVTDSKGCSDTALAVITQPTKLVATASTVSNVSCYGGNNGSATVSVSGGTSGYSYSWNTTPSQTSSTATSLTAGSYIVTVTDSKGCVDTGLAIVTQPSQLVASTSSITNVSCYGDNNGAATVTASGGTPGYSYSWNTTPAQTSATATGLTAGNYIVTVTDNNGCTDTALAVITQPAVLNAYISSSTNVSCNGGNNGTASTSVTGGTAPYSYHWNTLPVQTTSTATGLSAGTYIVTVTDSKGCTDTAQVTISEPTPLDASIVSTTKVSCNGGNNGIAVATASGGTPSYSYSWNTSPVKTTATATGLTAGVYVVTVTDSKGCADTAIAVISQSTSLVAALTSSSNVSCFGGSNGAAAVSATGGSPSYTYSWNTTPVQTTPAVTGLKSGAYVVTVTDSVGCKSFVPVAITQPAILNAAVYTTAKVSCNGGNNGLATVTTTGGTSPYSYSWNTSPVQTSVTATSLSAGNYIVTATDANGCTDTALALITQPPVLDAAIATTTNVSCHGGNNGTATVAVTGGNPGYTYSWATTPIQTSATATTLAAGTYIVTVKDTKGCIDTALASITEPAILSVSISNVNNVNCNGGSDGSATAAGAGGTPPYNYSWNTSPVQTSAIANGLSAGSYSVTVTDKNGCVSSTLVQITEPQPFVISATATKATCIGASDGEAIGSVSGGLSPYSYLWSTTPAQTTIGATGIPAGTYTFTATDAKGCSASATVDVMNYPKMQLNITPPSTLCQDKDIQLEVNGGSSYRWDNANTLSCSTCSNPVAHPLVTTTYQVVAADTNECMDSADVTVTLVTRHPTHIGDDQEICEGATARLQADGGIEYSWSPESSLDNSGVSDPLSHARTTTKYQVIIKQNECFSDTLYQTITVDPLPTIDLGPDRKAFAGDVIQLKAVTTNAEKIEWSPATGLSCTDCYGPDATIEKTITYKATVTNHAGCTAKDDINIIVSCDGSVFFVPNTFTPNHDGLNDVFLPSVKGIRHIKRMSIYNRWGQLLYDVRDFPANEERYGWNGTFNNEELKPDVFVYIIEAYCPSGEPVRIKGDISLIR